MNKYKIEKFYKNKKPFNLDSLIPNDIYQTFESNLLPESMFKAASTWIELNPEFNYHFYDKDDKASLNLNIQYDQLDNADFKNSIQNLSEWIDDKYSDYFFDPCNEWKLK